MAYASGSVVDVVITKFQEFDKDRNGTVELSELKAVLQLCDPTVWTDAKIEQLFITIDKNSDGAIQVEEFMGWALRSFEEPDFRKQLGFAKPKVAWRKFDMPVTYGSAVKILQGLHPAHKARALFERVAIMFMLAPTEIVFVIGRRQISYASIHEECLSDLGFAEYCFEGIEVPTLVVRLKARIDDIILELHQNRDASDLCLKDMWFAPVLDSVKRRATQLEQEGFECRMALVTKEKPKDQDPSEQHDSPLVVFWVGDENLDNPKTLYGKHVFSLRGEYPGTEKGLPQRWSQAAHLAGGLASAESKALLEQERAKAKAKADEMMRDAEEKDDKELALESSRLRHSTCAGVATMPLSKPGREMIQEAVAPFLMRIWEKISEHKDIRDDGCYVSDIKKDGFEIVKPKLISADPEDGCKRTQNSIMGVPLEHSLRIFKALQILDVEAIE